VFCYHEFNSWWTIVKLRVIVPWRSQSNHDTWATLLNKKSCVLTISYNFWSSGKRLILTIRLYSIISPRAVKMGWNSRANSAHHGFRPGWVEIFLQILIRVDFWPGSFRTRFIRVEPVVSRVGDKRVTQVFLFFLLSWVLYLGHVKLFFYPTHK